MKLYKNVASMYGRAASALRNVFWGKPSTLETLAEEKPIETTTDITYDPKQDILKQMCKDDMKRAELEIRGRWGRGITGRKRR